MVLSILQTVMGPGEAVLGASLPDNIIQGFVNTAPFSIRNDGDEDCISTEDFHTWCVLVPSIKKFLSSLMAQPSPGKQFFFIIFCIWKAFSFLFYFQIRAPFFV